MNRATRHRDITQILMQSFGTTIMWGTRYFEEVAAKILDLAWADEKKPDPPRMNVLGFQLIDEMTDEELIEEAVAFQRTQWEKASRNIRKKFVVEARLHLVKERLIEEAKFEPEAGPFGMLGIINE